MELALIAVALFLAFNNGANDNFKGFATVWGSDTLGYRQALVLATLATLAGSVASWLLADNLIQQFSGRGLVPNAVASTPAFILSVACGAALTVFLATRLGFPISTTHALIGGLIGAGLGQTGSHVDFNKLWQAFFVPLLISPLVAASLGLALYKIIAMRKSKNDCACLVEAKPMRLTSMNSAMLGAAATMPTLVISDQASCDNISTQASFSISSLLRKIHIGSAATICFARAVNDTPKLAALLFVAQFTNSKLPIALVGLLMAFGGLVFAKKVATTMSQKVTRLDDKQGLAANLITASLVLLASKFGLPVSTTHVSVGAIAGVGASAGTLNWQALRSILLSWLATLPLALVIAWTVSKLL
ncbi:MAG: inorganic phosphate transporter [Burkholderiaceae bacterium]